MNMEGKIEKTSMEGKASVIKETEDVKVEAEAEKEKPEVCDETQKEDGVR